jgi:hypothetical protein
MTEEKSQVISFRVSEEEYSGLKKYAESQGQSVNEAARNVVEKFLAGAPAPGPSPPPAPSPGPGLTDEVRELRRLFGELAEREEKTVRYLGDMCWRFNEVQGAVNQIMGALAPYVPLPPAFPQFPPPGWRRLDEAEKES